MYIEPNSRGFEVFVSYSRRDNGPVTGAPGWVDALVEEIKGDHAQFSTDPVRIFLDRTDIKSMDDWRQRILGALRTSRVLLVCLSPNYFKSQYCQWEFEEFNARQGAALAGHDTVAQVYFAETPDQEIGSEERTNWHQLLRRANYTDLRPWFPQGSMALREEVVRGRVASLSASLWERISRTRKASSAPGNLRRINRHFVGRAAELRRLHELSACGRMGQIVLVHGLGGQGKTELVTTYAHSYADHFSAGIWMLAAEGKRQLLALLAELAAEMGIGEASTVDESPDQKGRRVLAHLRQAALSCGPQGEGTACLLILDNVSEPDLVSNRELATLPSENWLRVIATSREGPEKLALGCSSHIECLPLDGLDENDAIRLLENHQPGESWPSETAAGDRESCRELVRCLDMFTLPIEAIAVFLGLNRDIRPGDLLARLRCDGLRSVLEIADDFEVGQQISHRERQVELVLRQTTARLGETDRAVLRYAAMMPPDCIPWGWLKEIVETEMPLSMVKRKGYPDPWTQVRRRLEGSRLLTPTDWPSAARMHRLTAFAVRAGSSYEITQAHEVQIRAFLAQPSTPFRDDAPNHAYRAAWLHVADREALIAEIKQRASRPEVVAELALKWIQLAYQLGDADLEAWWLEAGAAISSLRAAIVPLRASWLHRAGRTNEACGILQDLISEGGDDLALGTQLLMYLAQVGRYAEATDLADRLERQHAAALSENRLLKAHLLHSRYFVLHDQELNRDAVATGQLIVETYEALHLTYDHLIACVNLADAHWGIGEYQRAEKLLRQTHAKASNARLRHVEDIAAICLANVLRCRNATAEAEAFYEQGVRLSRELQHGWDYLYGRIHQWALLMRQRQTDFPALEQLRTEALEAQFGYLTALADGNACIALCAGNGDADDRDRWASRARESAFASARLYAQCLGVLRPVDKSTQGQAFAEMLQELRGAQGVKGSIETVARALQIGLELDPVDSRMRALAESWLRDYSGSVNLSSST